ARLGDQPQLVGQPEADRQRLEAAGDQPAERAGLRRRLVDMEGLRVVLEGEVEDLRFRQRDARRLEALADGEILEPQGHDDATTSAIAEPRSAVLAWPPRSGVFGPPSFSTVSMAFRMA